MTNRLNGRVAQLEARDAPPQGVQAWAEMIVPYGATPAEAEALIAAEQEKLPPGTGLIVRRVV